MTHNPSGEEIALLVNSALFRNLSPDQIQSVLFAAQRIPVRRNSFFFHQGEPATSFYMLLAGHARLTQITPEGRQIIMHFFGPGEAMAVLALVADEVYPLSAEATTDCVILGWDRSTTIQLMEQFPRLAINGLQMVAERFWELQARYRELATERVERRVAHAILRLVEQGNDRNAGQVPKVLSLSRQDVAEMSGTTHFSVSRICSNWEQQGILATGREQIAVLDVNALASIADDFAQPAPNATFPTIVR